MRKSAVLGCVLAVLALCVPQPVAAQDNAAEVSIGYTFLSNDQLAVNGTSLPFGFWFGAAFPMNDSISFAIDLSASYNLGVEPSDSLDMVVPALPTQDFQGLSFNRPETGWCSPVLVSIDCEVRFQSVTGVAGPRFHFGSGGVRPFVHIMAGLTRSLRKIDFFAHTSTNFTIQPGGGIDADITDNTAFRIEANYRTVFWGEPDQVNLGSSLVSTGGADFQDLSFSLGFVWRVGQR